MLKCQRGVHVSVKVEFFTKHSECIRFLLVILCVCSRGAYFETLLSPLASHTPLPGSLRCVEADLAKTQKDASRVPLQ